MSHHYLCACREASYLKAWQSAKKTFGIPPDMEPGVPEDEEEYEFEHFFDTDEEDGPEEPPKGEASVRPRQPSLPAPAPAPAPPKEKAVSKSR